jgi:hypothetical protein
LIKNDIVIVFFHIKRVNIFGKEGFHIPSSLACDEVNVLTVALDFIAGKRTAKLLDETQR